MQHVKITSGPLAGKTALLNKQGLVQLDGSKDMWRCSHLHPLCFGWHDPQGKVEKL